MKLVIEYLDERNLDGIIYGSGHVEYSLNRRVYFKIKKGDTIILPESAALTTEQFHSGEES